MSSAGPAGWQGRSNQTTRAIPVNANNDVLVQMTFLNTSGVPTEPTSIKWRLDSMTAVQNIQAWTSVAPTGSEQILQLPASIMVPTQTWFGTEIFQLWIQAVISDSNATSGSITVNKIVAFELIAESVPS